MSAKRFVLFLIISFAGCFSILMAIPQGPLPDAVFNKNIKTVLLHKQGWELSYPIIAINDEASLWLSFDDLDTNLKNYNYSIVLCDADWMPTRMAYSEYMDGFFQNPLQNYESSFSTHVPYTHYHLQIPSENVKIKLPGNYALLVYENGNEDEPVIIKRFLVIDEHVVVDGEARRPVVGTFMNEYQQVNFKVRHPEYAIENPYQTIKVVVLKNGIWKFSEDQINPVYVRESEIVYEAPDKNLFQGGNEYRSFDLKSMKYQSANIASMGYENGAYRMVLKPESPRFKAGYFFNEDINGKCLIQNQQGRTPETDADYVKVLFSLKLSSEEDKGNVFVFGAFTDFNCYDDNKMIYHPETGLYQVEALVKQGYHNYQYVYQPKGSTDPDEKYFEGSYYETENDYLILVYHRPYGARFDRLIGYKILNSLKQR